jgi:hypothetical protein
VSARGDAATTLSAFAARMIVQRQFYKGPLSNALARLRDRNARKWIKEPVEFIGDMRTSEVRYAASLAGDNPIWTAPMDRAWASVEDVFSSSVL